jgi:superfamily II DNA or RNA helicase
MWGGKLAFAEMLNAVAANDDRNSLLVNLTLDLAKTRKKVLLISAFREHCDHLAELLRATVHVTVLHGGTRKRKLEEACSILVATYGLLEEGFDDADLDTVVLCTPRSTVQQTIGRIERTKEGKAIPLVYDIVDHNPVFFAMWEKRKKFYKSRGFRVEDEPRKLVEDFGFVLEE